MSASERAQRLEHEAFARQMGEMLKRAFPPDVGFALVVFDLGGPGNMSYIANGVRTDMATMFRELADKLDAAPPAGFTKPGDT